MVRRAGIDLGTTYSLVAVMVNGRPEIVRNGCDNELTQSAVCICDGEILVGEEAYARIADGTAKGITAFKSRMGDDSVLITGNGRGYSAKDLSTILLNHLIKEAENRLGDKITEVVITVPHYFDEARRIATKEAGEACGVRVLKLLNEPTSAALYYGYNHFERKTIMVYDLGGGTFDTNVIHFENGKTEVISTHGNHSLGGKDWDKELALIACRRFAAEYDINPFDDESFRNVLMATAEKVKKQLSAVKNAIFQIEYEGKKGSYSISRDEFRDATLYLMHTTRDLCEEALQAKGLKWQDIDEILLIGGSSRMPIVQEYLAETTPCNIVHHPDMELAVAKGAAIDADRYRDGISDKPILHDITSHSLGALSIKENEDRFINEIIIPKNSKIPFEATKAFKLEKGNRANYIEVYALQGESRDPDECVVVTEAVINGFRNDGNGVIINVTYSYDENGVVKISADSDGRALNVTTKSLPDIDWISGRPSERAAMNNTEKNIVVCLDLSRSMTFKDKNSGAIPLDEAKDSIKQFVESLGTENNHFALIGFGDSMSVLCDLTRDLGKFKGALEKTRAKDMGRGTRAIPLGLAKSVAESDGRMGIIVTVTDGEWEKKDAAVLEARKIGMPIFAIGFGDANEGFLRQISTVEKGALYTTIDRLGHTFQTIATAIRTDSMNLRDPSED